MLIVDAEAGEAFRVMLAEVILQGRIANLVAVISRQQIAEQVCRAPQDGCGCPG